jgi:hypothetical protein
VTTLEWTCDRCGELHVGLPFDWGFSQPSYWDGGRDERDFLDDDLCAWTDDAGRRNYFIRGVLAIPVVDAEEPFTYGVWSSLSEDSFMRIVELWNDPPPYFGWLSNSLAAYPETLNLPVSVTTRELELRPWIVLQDADHPLVAEQRRGITVERVRELAELNLHAS